MTRARRGHESDTLIGQPPRAQRRAPRGWGKVRRLPSGRIQASYLDASSIRRTAPSTFATRLDADAWLARQRAALDAGTWRDPDAGAITFAAYARTWLADRELATRTREHYARVLAGHILPAFGTMPLASIAPAAVRAWHTRLASTTGPAMRAHAYGLLRTIMGTAVTDDLIPASPCRVRGAGTARRARTIRPATLPELEALTEAMPARHQLMVLLAAWCGLRFGELAELRRADIDARAGVIHIRRGVVQVSGGHLVKGPKSEAGRRDVAIPPHLMPAVRDHLAQHTGHARDALLFPAAGGGHLSPSALYRMFGPARCKAGRPDLRFHDLRHTGATMAAATGASLAELMRRLGHSTPGAAMRYQHAADDRDQAIANMLSEFAGAKVVQLRPRAKAGNA